MPTPKKPSREVEALRQRVSQLKKKKKRTPTEESNLKALSRILSEFEMREAPRVMVPGGGSGAPSPISVPVGPRRKSNLPIRELFSPPKILAKKKKKKDKGGIKQPGSSHPFFWMVP